MTIFTKLAAGLGKAVTLQWQTHPRWTCYVNQTHHHLMSLGTGAIKGWWGSGKNTRHSREVPWQPCEWELALQAATNEHCHTEGTSVEKLTWPNNNSETLPMRGGKGSALNWQNRQWSSDLQSSTEQANCRYDDQSSDLSKAVIHKD